MPLLPATQPATVEKQELSPAGQPWSWSRHMWRFRLQFQAMAAACVVFTAGGMRIAWSIFHTPTGRFLSNENTHYLMVAGFLGAALGALLATTFVQRVTKNVAFTLSGFLLLTGGLLSILLPEHFVAVCYSSISVGIAYGMSHVQALVTGGEVAHPSIRGMLVASERCCSWLGVCLQLLYARVWYAWEPATQSLHVDQLHGIILASLGLLVVVLALVHRVESPLLLMRQQREVAATNALRRLNSTSNDTTELLLMRDNCRQFMAQDSMMDDESVSVRWRHSNASQLLPLCKILVLRCFTALALSLPFNRAFLLISWHGFACDTNCLYWLAVCGLLGSITGALLVDEHGRRKLCVVSLFVAGIIIFLVGGVFHHLETSRKIYYNIDLDMIAGLMLIFAFIMAAGVAVPVIVYTAEAFPQATKATCIGGIFACEQVLQVVIMVIIFHRAFKDSVFFFTFGALSMIFGLIVFCLMPETRHLTLYECLQKFRKVP